MKKTIILSAALVALACNEKQNTDQVAQEAELEINLEIEYAKLEETRQAFQLALKEKRYGI